MLLFEGLVSGLAAGIFMGLISHAGFKARIFRSSLLIIDGSFTLKSLRIQYDEQRSVLLGIPVHLLTSISFGLAYALLVNITHLEPTNGSLISLYVFVLWLSMLFVALPVAGHGFLGKRLGASIWFEQLILHIIFGIGLWSTLHLLR